MARFVRILFALACITPAFALADILDEPFFGGALGRAAYSVPVEFVRHTEWKNELRFSFPPDTRPRIENFIARGVEQAYSFAENLSKQSGVFASASAYKFLEIVKGVRVPAVQFKAHLYATASQSVESESAPYAAEPEIIYVESAPSNVPLCSRSGGLAHYTWCRMSAQKVF